MVGLSGLLTSTMNQMGNVMACLADKRDHVKIMVGGAPVIKRYADEIGAGGYTPDAGSAVDMVRVRKLPGSV